MEIFELETKNPQYSYMVEEMSSRGAESMGLVSSTVWRNDPKRLGFVLARYKFVAKMFEGFNTVLEVGCGDGWASRVVSQSVTRLVLSDFDPIFVEDALSRSTLEWPLEGFVHDFCFGPYSEKFDGIYLLDVFEHIDQKYEREMLVNIKASMKKGASMVLGCPSIESQALIPEHKRDPGHINCKTGAKLRSTVNDVFCNAFLFSMNDEMISVSNPSMAFYNFILAVNMD